MLKRFLSACLFFQCAYSAAWHCQLQDGLQQGITLTKPAKRIISLAPNLTELVVSAGAQKNLVAVDSASNYPEAIRHLPKVGSSSNIDAERILTLRPDLILVWGQGANPKTLHRLSQQHIPIYHARFDHLQDIATVLRDIGCLTQHSRIANQQADNFQAALKALKQHYQPKPWRSAIYQIWPKPLMVVGGKGFIAESLSLCHAKNPFHQVAKAVFSVSLEQIILHDPAVIIVNDKRDLAAWRPLKKLTAVKKNHFIVINPDCLERPSLRILHGIKQLCAQVQPVVPEKQ